MIDDILHLPYDEFQALDQAPKLTKAVKNYLETVLVLPHTHLLWWALGRGYDTPVLPIGSEERVVRSVESSLRKIGDHDNDLTVRAMKSSNTLDRNITILRERFALEDGYKPTLEEVGARHGLNIERIRQIEAKSLAIFRRHLDPSLVNLLPKA